MRGERRRSIAWSALIVVALVGCERPCERDANGSDGDGDGWVDRCDNCPGLDNTGQDDADHDGRGDACDPDDDGDGTLDEADNCPRVFHPHQDDADGDGIGDACDPCPLDEDRRDGDGDGADDCADPCPDVADDGQDSDGDGVGDACDLCPSRPDAGQGDRDGDGVGDACDDGGFSVVELTIDDLHAALGSGEISCEEVVEAHLDRIHALDLDVSAGPPINAIVSLNTGVRAQARGLDAGGFTGTLHCVPLLIKDLYGSTDIPVGSGSLALAETWATRDATAVAGLRDEGALILGTSTMDEFSMGVTSHSSRSGRSGNPYATDRNPGGSSSGSGAGVSASFALGPTGTDNCASLILPGAYNGLVSLRPSVGLISMHGIMPSNRLDAAPGPLARTVADLARLLDAMAGRDARDERTQDPEAHRPRYVRHLRADGLVGKRLGVVRVAGGAHQGPMHPYGDAPTDSLRTFGRALRQLEDAGAVLVENVGLPQLDTDRAGGVGFREDIDAFFARVTGPIGSFNALCASGRYSRFVWKSEAACRNARSHASADKQGTLAQRYQANRATTEAVMDGLGLDALVYPADALGHAHTLQHASNCRLTSVSQMPALTFPVGLGGDPPSPVGLVVHGRKWDEATLIEIAYAFEQATGWRVAPALPDAVPAAPADLALHNAVRLDIGETAWTEILRDGDRYDLSAVRMQGIVEEVLAGRGLDHLLE